MAVTNDLMNEAEEEVDRAEMFDAMGIEAQPAAEKATPRLFMCRIPPVSRERYHLVGDVTESDPTSEPSRAFWTNKSVKALMQQTPQPEYASLCGKVRGDWRSVQTSTKAFMGELCKKCAALKAVEELKGETNGD